MRRTAFHGFVWCLLGISVLLFGCRSTPEPRATDPGRQPPEFAPFPGDPLRLPGRHRPIEDFERLASLQVISDSGSAFLLKNTSQAIWGSSAGEIRYLPEKSSSHSVTLLPELPWRMPSLFDNLALWVRDAGDGGAEGEHQVLVHLRDGMGNAHTIPFSYSPSNQWQLLQTRFTEPYPLPVSIENLQWVLPDKTESPRRILLEGLTLYQEVLSRIPSNVAYVRPFGYAPAFAPLRENSVTLNFPTTAFAFRPQKNESRHVTELTEERREEYVFTSTSSSGTMAYKVIPEEGGPEIEIRTLNGKWEKAWTGPRVETLGEPPKLRFGRIRDQELSLQYTDGVRFSVGMENQTLVISVESMREEVSGLDLGKLYGDQNVPVPFLRTGIGKPIPVRFKKDSHHPLFLSAFPDWWFSMASTFKPGEDERSVGKMIYTPRWRGSRNLFRERIYFTASPRIGEILPTVSTPTSMYYADASEKIWPDPALQYHSLFKIRPTEEIWRDSLLSRNPDGEWRPFPDLDGVVLKTTLAEEVIIPRLLREHSADSDTVIFLPETTSHGPWEYTDFDNRVIGAGTFTQTYAEMGALMQQAEAEWGGPIFGKGGAELLWAGLISGFVPEFESDTLWQDPWIPHFSWNAIAPVSKLIGMGGIPSFQAPGESTKQKSIWLDRSIATQVVYGAVGRIPFSGYYTEKELQHAKQLLDAFQTSFLHKSADRIAYWNGKEFTPLATAFQEGDKDRNQLYIRLSDQTELWVNGSPRQIWERRVGDAVWDLPPFGVILRGPDLNIVHLPQSKKDPRLTWVETAASSWLYSPDQQAEQGGLRLKGSLTLHKEAAGEWRVEVSQWHGEAGFDTAQFDFKNVRSIQGIDQNGKVLSQIQLNLEDRYWILRHPEPLQTVWLSESPQGQERNLSP